MMRTDLQPGAIVEVTDRGSDKAQYAVVVNKPANFEAPNDTDTFVWVRYENGCVVPIREYYVAGLTPDWIVAQLNKAAREI
jgi:hypothetical protein